MGDVLEQKEAQLAEVLAASNLDPATLTQLNAVSAHLMLIAVSAHLMLNAVSAHLMHAVTAWQCMKAAWPVPARLEVVLQAVAPHRLSCMTVPVTLLSSTLNPCPGCWWTPWEVSGCVLLLWTSCCVAGHASLGSGYVGSQAVPSFMSSVMACG